jgi:hypothetical protein
VASFEMSMDRDIARVPTRLEATIEGVTRPSGDRGSLGITANASVDVAGDSFDLLSIEAEKLMLLPTHA